MPHLLKAFIARSFLPEDEKRLEPILSFLETFKSIGFICRSAEPAEVESVSAKVRRLIDDSDVFIGIFTRRYPFYELKPGIPGALQVARRIAPRLWTAPPWVLQESGYALQKMGIKRLILLREAGVEAFGLQGDLEYIPFAVERPSDIFSKLSEMIHGLLAEVSGTQVEVVVTQRQEEERTAPEPNLPQPKTEAPKDDTEEPSMIDHYLEMSKAMKSRDFRALGEARRAGTALIEAGKETSLDQLAWDCHYYEFCFAAGDADALENLRKMRADNPDRLEPVASTARCLYESKEYEESAELYLKAAELSKEDYKAWYLVRATIAFHELKQYPAGKKAAYAALATATGDVKSEALTALYEVLKDGGETYLAFATAESALHENPQVGLRFKLGLDYHSREMYELALFHFKFLHERDNTDSSSPTTSR